MKLLIFGPQASGKGTQAEILAKRMNIPHISVGEKLREEVASGSELGLKIKDMMNKGYMVPDSITDEIVKKAIEGSEGFILDGYPRNIHQAGILDSITKIDKAILIEVPDAVAIERITGRRECPEGHSFHTKYKPPKEEGKCDICGKELTNRKDDTEGSIKRRLSFYHESTEPLASHYRDVLLEIDGTKNIQEVAEDIQRGLE